MTKASACLRPRSVAAPHLIVAAALMLAAATGCC
jgi:hypothetical protein